MIHSFPIEFVRQILEQTLLKKHIEDLYYFGGKNQIELFSFYEQLKNQDEVDRFVERYRDLTEQQNRTCLIGNGILLSPENPTITNLYKNLIVPMTWTCSIRTMLENRDQMIDTLFELINELKGRKVDIAELKCVDDNGGYYYQPFAVGTIGHNDNYPALACGDYIGDMNKDNPTNQEFYTQFASLYDTGHGVAINTLNIGDYFYFGGVSKLCVGIVAPKDIPVDDYELDYYINTSGNKKIISGTLTCRSEDTYLNLPTINDFKFFLNVYDNDKDEFYEIPVGINEEETQLDQNNRIFIKGSWELELGEYEFDWNNVNIDLGDTPGELTSNDTKKYQAITDDGTRNNVIFPPDHISFEKYKVSMSFDSLRCDTPKTLNGKEYCEISFGGSSTLVSNGVKLGNDLLKVSFQKNKIVADTDITFNDANVYYLEPLEMPSGNGASSIPNHLVSNAFKVNSHTDSLTLTLQYTFIADDTNDLLKQWFNYGRYGTYGITATTISPNMIYNVVEWWCSWGVVSKCLYLGKLIESVDIENTESDTLTLSITMQVQGSNN